MENDGDKPTDENPNPSASAAAEPGSTADDPAAAPAPPARTPFTSLSQLDADLALARTLQEQERAYMMLRMDGEYLSSDEGSYVHGDEFDGDEFEGDELEGEEDPGHAVLEEEEEAVEVEEEGEEEEEEEDEEEGSVQGSDYDDEDEDDDFDVDEDGAIDPADFENDEAYARALQDAEEREVAVRLMALAGLNDWGVEDLRGQASHSQDTWQDVDPDELSYEELIALGEAVGTESRGLSADTIASLPSVNYIAESTQDGDPDPCVICRLDYEDGDSLVVLSCKHSYHSECINKWLQINKVCPVCSTEVSTSGSAHT